MTTVEMHGGRCTVIDIVNIDPGVRRICISLLLLHDANIPANAAVESMATVRRDRQSKRIRKVRGDIEIKKLGHRYKHLTKQI